MNTNKIEPGKYRAKAVTHHLSITSTGKEFYYIRFKITDGPYHGETVEWKGYFGEDKYSSGKTATDLTLATLQTCGWNGVEPIDEITALLNEVSIVVWYKTYKGVEYPEVRYVNPLYTGPQPLDKDKAHAFAARVSQQHANRVSPASLPQEDAVPF